MFNHLKKSDDRLIRYNLQSEDAKKRQRIACNMDLHNVLILFTSKYVTDEDKNKAAFVISSCTIDNPRNRHNIGTYNDGSALQILVEMLEVKSGEQSAIDGAALAAEAIWILTFNNANNHHYFLSNDTISSLSDLVKYENESLSTQRLKMWAAAALQNIAASYCETSTGHCWWDYYGADGLYLLPESPLRDELGDKAREIVMHDTDLVSLFKRGVCKGPISTHPMPSKATNTDNLPTQIVTWAYVGVIKNLALSGSAPKIFSPIINCLCDLSHSQDWLESSKAEDAIIRLGMEGSCPPPHYNNCEDFDGWENDIGEICSTYAENDWCEEFGHLSSKDGVTAKEACCYCNGGNKIVPGHDNYEEL